MACITVQTPLSRPTCCTSGRTSAPFVQALSNICVEQSSTLALFLILVSVHMQPLLAEKRQHRADEQHCDSSPQFVLHDSHNKGEKRERDRERDRERERERDGERDREREGDKNKEL